MNKYFPNSVTKYLSKNLRSEWELEWNETLGIHTVIVVPAICEYENIKNLLLSLSENSKSCFENSLIIFVINRPYFASKEVQSDNKLSLEFLRTLIKNIPVNQNQKKIIESGINIGLVDASSERKEFDDKEAGVGMARKIGMDLALQIFDYPVAGRKLIVSLDADCLVKDNYLVEIQNYFNQENCLVAVMDFEHIVPDDELIETGILSYEIFLRHYVAGLLFAKSPFAFHTIGSTIVCDHEAYIKVGGMNTRNAAEDFYFLQKLAKNFKVQRITTTKVKPYSRESWRVPFGTGRSMTDFLSKEKKIFVFDPNIYVILKDWLSLFNSDCSLNPDLILHASKKIHPELYNFLVNRRFNENWTNILNNSKSSKQLEYQRINWFDALETLKLVHHLRDSSFPMQNIKSGVENLFKVAKHSVKFDPESEISNQIQLLRFYLSELKILENNLYQNFNL